VCFSYVTLQICGCHRTRVEALFCKCVILHLPLIFMFMNANITPQNWSTLYWYIYIYNFYLTFPYVKNIENKSLWILRGSYFMSGTNMHVMSHFWELWSLIRFWRVSIMVDHSKFVWYMLL
jgi:hypothetical protein